MLYFRSKQYKVFLQGFVFNSSRWLGHILWYMGIQFKYWCLLKVVYWMCDCAKLTFAGIAAFSSSREDDSFGPLCWCEACLATIKSLLRHPLHLVHATQFWRESGDVWAAWCGGCRPYWSIDQSKFYNGSFSQLLRPIFKSQNLSEWLTSG
jgi:hypothetical protein